MAHKESFAINRFFMRVAPSEMDASIIAR